MVIRMRIPATRHTEMENKMGSMMGVYNIGPGGIPLCPMCRGLVVRNKDNPKIYSCRQCPRLLSTDIRMNGWIWHVTIEKQNLLPGQVQRTRSWFWHHPDEPCKLCPTNFNPAPIE